MKPLELNLLELTDSYKPTHWRQYPPSTEKIHSYAESRGGQFAETPFFGLQYALKSYLEGKAFDLYDVEEFEKVCQLHFNDGSIFNKKGWMRLLHKHDGRLPVEIRAVPEGTVVPVSNVLMTIENTDPEFPWLTNYLESLLLEYIWYPTTVCTISREIKKVIAHYLAETADTLGGLDFKLHDFGYRGASSTETAAIGGAAHLVNFKGSDTMVAMKMIRQFYNWEPDGPGWEISPGYSIPAAEHSTITSWGQKNEVLAFGNMLAKFPKGLVAVVSDSYDIFNACSVLWGDVLKDQVLVRDGVLVVRPDSGDPLVVVPKVIELLAEKFGYEVNSKGYKILCPKVRVIQGDGVNYHSIREILRAVTARGWSADNLVFGMGGALLQQVNRDTQKFAFKASLAVINGVEHEVFKQPKTDTGKNSKRGRLALVRTNHGYSTVPLHQGIGNPDDILVPVFLDGKVITDQTFDDIRERAAIESPLEVAA